MSDKKEMPHKAEISYLLEQIDRYAHEIKTRANPHKDNGLQLGGIYWRARKILEAANYYLDLFETESHSEFLRSSIDNKLVTDKNLYQRQQGGKMKDLIREIRGNEFELQGDCQGLQIYKAINHSSWYVVKNSSLVFDLVPVVSPRDGKPAILTIFDDEVTDD